MHVEYCTICVGCHSRCVSCCKHCVDRCKLYGLTHALNVLLQPLCGMLQQLCWLLRNGPDTAAAQVFIFLIEKKVWSMRSPPGTIQKIFLVIYVDSRTHTLSGVKISSLFFKCGYGRPERLHVGLLNFSQ